MQQKEKKELFLRKSSVKKISVISTILIILFLSAPFYINLSYANTAIKQVQGIGDSLQRFTCSNGQRPFGGSLLNEIITFNAIQTQGQPVSGQFKIEGVDANGASKQGTIDSIDISVGMFTLTGRETSDTLCGGDTTPSDITISGDCKIQDNLPVAQINFVAQNGERGTFTGGVSCVISLDLLFKNQGQCIDFANHNPNNTQGITKQACMQAFQNKFNG
jgi:hypothetical protein